MPLRPPVLKHVWFCVCLHVLMHAVHVHTEAREHPWMLFLKAVHLFSYLRQGLSPRRLGWLASEPQVCLSLPPQHWGCKCASTPGFSAWVLGIEHGEHFMYGIYFPALLKYVCKCSTLLLWLWLFQIFSFYYIHI